MSLNELSTISSLPHDPSRLAAMLYGGAGLRSTKLGFDTPSFVSQVATAGAGDSTTAMLLEISQMEQRKQVLLRKLQEQASLSSLAPRRLPFPSTLRDIADAPPPPTVDRSRLGEMNSLEFERFVKLSAARNSSEDLRKQSPRGPIVAPTSRSPSPLAGSPSMGPVAPVRKVRIQNFPQKLHQMLSDLEQREGGSEIASFLPGGMAFAIHRPLDFVKHVMPQYFERMTRFSSFQRQLNLYDFQRITEGPDAGAYYHELFVYGKPLLCTWMKRVKIKGSKKEKQQQQEEK